MTDSRRIVTLILQQLWSARRLPFDYAQLKRSEVLAARSRYHCGQTRQTRRSFRGNESCTLELEPLDHWTMLAESIQWERYTDLPWLVRDHLVVVPGHLKRTN